MSRVDARRRGIPRTGSTETVRQACTIRLWAKRALFQLARVFPAVDRASSHPRFSPVSREPDCFPESAPGSARHAYRGLNTHLDLGRLEGRDGAGESGGNAGHFCSCFFVLKEGEVCRNGARDAPNAHFIGAQLIHGRVGRRTTVSANRRARKNPVEQIYWRPGFYSRGSLTVVTRWLYGYPVLNNAGSPDFPNRRLASIHRPLRLALRIPVLWKYDPGWEIETEIWYGHLV